MKLKDIKYLILGLSILGVFISGCDDDDNLGDATRLFRPIAKATASNNNIVVAWDLLKSAGSYQLELSKDTFKTIDETVEVNSSPYSFTNLAWDEPYQIRIKALSTSIGASGYYECEYMNLTYPTRLEKVSDIIDVAARIKWKSETNYSSLDIQQLIDGSYTSVLAIPLSEEDRINMEKIVYDLSPETSYRVIAYSGDSESLIYEGRQNFKTAKPENYGDNSVDLRILSDDVAKEILTTEYLDELLDNVIVVLKGGFEYKCDATISKGIKFITGLSLEGNAIVKTGGMLLNDGNIGDVTFEKVNFITSGDKTASNFGGKYIFNQNKLSNVNNMTFKDCSIRYMRGFIRLQSKATVIKNITIDNCILDSIGGYGVLNADVAGAQFDNVTIQNTTMANCEKTLVNSKSDNGFAIVNIKNCTFAYCSKGTNYIFDFGNKATLNPNLSFNVENCLFGSSFGQAAAATNGYRCSGENARANIVNCYKTSELTWIKNDAGNEVAPIPEITEYGKKDKELWEAPLKSDFTIKDLEFEGAKTAGDPRWR